jgi:Pre-SET motif.
LIDGGDEQLLGTAFAAATVAPVQMRGCACVTGYTLSGCGDGCVMARASGRPPSSASASEPCAYTKDGRLDLDLPQPPVIYECNLRCGESSWASSVAAPAAAAAAAAAAATAFTATPSPQAVT